MGNGELWPPTESKPLNSLPKNCHSWLRPRDDPLYQFWCKSFDGGFLGKWVKYNVKLFLHTYVHTYVRIPSFSGNNPQVRPYDRFWRVMTQKTRNHARMCLLGVTKIKGTFNPFLGPLNVDFWRKNGLRKFSTENRLQWALPRVKYS